MKISINNLELKGQSEASSNISYTTTTYSENAVKPLSTSSRVINTETFSSGEKAIVEAFVNLINSK
jgi:hypothetical protein